MVDVIVVGARVAGATLATLLARSGAKVLLLDAHALPSGMPMSTHFLHAPGMGVLDEIGVGDAIRACNPPTKRFRFQVEEHVCNLDRTPDRYQYCPRRSTLDPLLLKTAQEAGAEVIDHARVTDLVRDGDRVAGVVAQTADGLRTFHAPLVVGADGRHSAVAKLVGAQTYLGFDMTRAGYWFYFAEPPGWQRDEPYADWQGYMGYRGDTVRYVFQCDGGQVIALTAPPNAEVHGWKGDLRGGALADFRKDPVTRAIADSGPPIGKGVGLLKAEFFYRRASGPGWALVGDAGHFKDFVTGHGMTEALLGARHLHAAILEGGDAALERYWRERDVRSMPWYFEAKRMGHADVNDAFNRVVGRSLERDPELARRMVDAADRKLSPLEVFSPGRLLWMVAGALLRGQFDVLPAFLRAGRQMGEFQAILAERARLLAALPPKAPPPGAPFGAASFRAMPHGVH